MKGRLLWMVVANVKLLLGLLSLFLGLGFGSKLPLKSMQSGSQHQFFCKKVMACGGQSFW